MAPSTQSKKLLLDVGLFAVRLLRLIAANPGVR